MPGSTNFQQWNPTEANQETDAQYTADGLRSGGASLDGVFPSATANKAFYQWSTFIAAFASMLVAKGYSPSDANLGNLAAVLANIMTAEDMASYALLNSPSFTGTPTVPNVSSGDNSTKAANTAFVAAAISAAISAALAGLGSAVTIAGGWVVVTFGSQAGSRTRLAFGGGSLSSGASVPLPSGFSAANSFILPAPQSYTLRGGHEVNAFSLTVSNGAITMNVTDETGYVVNGNIAWLAIAWQTGY